MSCPKKVKNIVFSVLVYSLYMSLALGVALAASTSNFTQTINAGTLSVDIVNGSYVTVGSPTVAMGAVTFSFACRTSGNRASGTFGTASEQIYVQNPDAADGGWTVSLAGSAATNVWDSAGTDYDFNDSSGSGCTDGGDADSVGGQMTVDASGGTLAAGACSACTTANITKGSANSYVQATTDSITLLTAAAGSDDIGDWTLQGVSILNTIPAEQPAASDYDINMTLSII